MIEVGLSPLELDPAGPLRRTPPRPPHQQQADYLEKFDFHTVFYDCFVSVDGENVVLIGPPLANLQPIVFDAVVSAFRLPGALDPQSYRRLPLCTQIRLPMQEAPAAVPPGRFVQSALVAQPNLAAIFAGKRVVTTMNKDNELVWIRDWAYFYAARHACNGVLIYDNGSTRYDRRDIFNAISSARGIDTCVVVHWPYKYGPTGGPHRIWDSLYCQMCMLEHARHRFLALAQGVINADIDEFVLTSDGAPVFRHLARSRTGYLVYRAQWVENATMAAADQRRHKDFIYRSKMLNRPADSKWTVDPARCAPHAQWIIHKILWMDADLEASKHVTLRHFIGITNNWRGPRWKPERPNERDHAVDHKLAAWMRIFDPPSPAPSLAEMPGPPPGSSAGVNETG